MITIFTPVYNRAYIMEQLYQSLLNQTCYDFEWIIMDDGSTDCIESLVSKWMQDKQRPFEIIFLQQENGGKHRAINRGVQCAQGNAFFIVDSDDYIEKNAIEWICEWWKEIEKDGSFAGVAGLRATSKGKVVGDQPTFTDYVDATNIEREKYGLLGDKAEVYKTSILKKYPFPEFEGENFLPEAIVWDKIANDGLKMRWMNKVIYICEYLNDGLTYQWQTKCKSNPVGWGRSLQSRNLYYRWPDKERIYQYTEYYLQLKDALSLREIQNNLGSSKEEFEIILKYLDECIQNTIEKIGKKIAVYGMGARGRKVLNLYSGSEVEIVFVMDRRVADYPVKYIDIDETYPMVDAILVTPKEGQDAIICALKEKTGNRIVGYEEWKKCIEG